MCPRSTSKKGCVHRLGGTGLTQVPSGLVVFSWWLDQPRGFASFKFLTYQLRTVRCWPGMAVKQIFSAVMASVPPTNLLQCGCRLAYCRMLSNVFSALSARWWRKINCQFSPMLTAAIRNATGARNFQQVYKTTEAYLISVSPARLLDDQKTSQQVWGGCKVFSAYFRPLSDLLSGWASKLWRASLKRSKVAARWFRT